MSAVKVSFNGRISTDPKVYGEGSSTRLFFNVAANRTYVKSDGTKETATEFVPCTVWGEKRVETLKRWLLKGRLISVSGDFRSHETRDEQGNFVRKDWVVRVDEIEFLDRKPEIQEPAQPQTQPQSQAQGQPANVKALVELLASALGGYVGTGTAAGTNQGENEVPF